MLENQHYESLMNMDFGIKITSSKKEKIELEGDSLSLESIIDLQAESHGSVCLKPPNPFTTEYWDAKLQSSKAVNSLKSPGAYVKMFKEVIQHQIFLQLSSEFMDQKPFIEDHVHQ